MSAFASQVSTASLGPRPFDRLPNELSRTVAAHGLRERGFTKLSLKCSPQIQALISLLVEAQMAYGVGCGPALDDHMSAERPVAQGCRLLPKISVRPASRAWWRGMGEDSARSERERRKAEREESREGGRAMTGDGRQEGKGRATNG